MTIRIYSYGCLPPMTGGDIVDEQLYRAHRYRNALVEIDRRKRERIAEIQRHHDVLGPMLDAIDMTETTIAEGRRTLKTLDTGGARDRRANKPERDAVVDMVAAGKADLSVLRLLRTAVKAIYRVDEKTKTEYALTPAAYERTMGGSPYLTAYVRPWQRLGQAVHAAVSGHPGERLECEYAIVSDLAAAEMRAARAASGLASGTYLIVEETVARAQADASEPLRFLRYDGSGRLAVQLTQGGMTPAELESGDDSRLALLPGQPRTSRKGTQQRIPANARTVRIRVAPGGVTATLPVIYHRSIPEDAMVKWAWILRRREGVRFRYYLQLTLAADSFDAPRRIDKGVIAVDIGARDLPDGSTRVAYWLDSHGDHGEVVPKTTRLSSPARHGAGRREVPDDLGKVNDLAGIRSRHLEQIRDRLISYRHSIGDGTLPVHDWLRDRTTHLYLWRSPARIGALYRDWERHDGDQYIYEHIGAYLKQDRHLLDWQTNERNRHHGRVRARYQEWAVGLARKYSTVVIAQRSYLRQEQVPEDGLSTQGHESRKIMRHVAPGELREEIARATAKYGARLVEVKLEGDTAWALDRRVCERLLASDEVVRNHAQPLATISGENVRGSDYSARRRRLGTPATTDPLAKQDVSPHGNT